VINRDADLVALQREIYSDQRSQGTSHEQIMAAMIDLESRQRELLSYAAAWDAAAAAQRGSGELLEQLRALDIMFDGPLDHWPTEHLIKLEIVTHNLNCFSKAIIERRASNEQA
jgi:hypothetical protein